MTLWRKKNRSPATVSSFASKSLNQQNIQRNAEQHQWEWEQLIWTWCTVGFVLEPTLNSRITLCVRPKLPSSLLYTIAKAVGSRKSSRYNRFLVTYDLVITDIRCVYLDTRPNFSTKFARYIRLLFITGLVIYDFYCNCIDHPFYMFIVHRLVTSVFFGGVDYCLSMVSAMQASHIHKKIFKESQSLDKYNVWLATRLLQL